MDGTWGDAPVSYSPDGGKYVIRLLQDDLERNGTSFELFAGRTDTLDGASARSVTKLFTIPARDDATGRLSAVYPTNEIVWLADSERVAFLWTDGASPMQVMSVDLRTNQMKALTDHSTSVFRFMMSEDGNVIFYSAYPKRARDHEDRVAALVRNGFAVSSPDAVQGILAGNLDGFSPWENIEHYISAPESGTPRRISCRELNCGHYANDLPVSFSPDRKYAVIPRVVVSEVREEWSQYPDRELRRALNANHASWFQHVGIVDVERAELRPLWNVPNPVPPLGKMGIVWSPDSQRLLVGPTFLPLEQADTAGLTGVAVAEVDVSTGRVWPVSVPAEFEEKGLAPKRWNVDGTIELADGDTRYRFRKIDGEWRMIDAPQTESADKSIDKAPIRIELRQDLNVPPAFFAVDEATGQERMILDVEPRLRNYRLGRVENVEWRDSRGRTWQGRLHYPVEYSSKRTYPLVIQIMQERSTTKFALFGSEDSIGTAFAAQALANKDMAVLALYPGRHVGQVAATPQEGEFIIEGVESAVSHFVHGRLADRSKIGLVGYSRTGWYVTHVLTHSSFPFAAAIASDNINKSYMESVLAPYLGAETSLNFGADPYGDGLEAWLEHAPGFNVHNVHTPLRLESMNGGVMGLLMSWEMYSRLHYLKRPVELVSAPDSQKGSHPAQLPVQKRFSQEGTVDWMDFWLNGREDPDQRKAEQYERWRKLRTQQEAVIAERRKAGEDIADLPPLQTISSTRMQ